MTNEEHALRQREHAAWYEAARCWQEARAARDPALRSMLASDARGAEAYWRSLRRKLDQLTQEGVQ